MKNVQKILQIIHIIKALSLLLFTRSHLQDLIYKILGFPHMSTLPPIYCDVSLKCIQILIEMMQIYKSKYKFRYIHKTNAFQAYT